MKFCEHGGITVRLASQPSTGGRRKLTLAVQDTGIGIPLGRQDELFKPFVQIDNSLTRRAGGTGLGLAIVKHVLMRHGAALKIESEPGKGSAFIAQFARTGPVLAS